MHWQTLRYPALRVVGPCILIFAIAGEHSAAPVAWSGASATFDQNYAGGIAGAIDGNVNTSGWALFGDQFAPQTAIFTTAAPLDNIAQLHFGLYFYSGFDGHNINEFRISLTTDPSPSLASSWASFPLTDLRAQQPITSFTQVGDNRVRAQQNVFGTDAYGATAVLPPVIISGITGFRLETFPFDFDPGDAMAASAGRSSNGNIVLTEFVVDDANPLDFPTNHAFLRPATTNGSLYSGTPAILTDGNRSSNVHGDGPGGPTGVSPAPGFYYQVDLGTEVDVSHIDIWPRQDGCCPDRLTNYRVSIHEDAGGAVGPEVWRLDQRTDGSFPAPGPTGPDVASAGAGVGTPLGRWVRVTSLQNPIPNYALQLGEIEVYGDVVGPPLPQNVALFKPTSGDVYPGFPTSNGNDANPGSISHSDNVGPVFWQVDLQNVFNLDSVELVNRADGCCPERLNGAFLSVLDANFDTLFTSDPITAAGVGQVFTFDNGGAGFGLARYIRVDHMGQYLSVAEVRAFGAVIPEPTTWLVALSAILAALGVRRRLR